MGDERGELGVSFATIYRTLKDLKWLWPHWIPQSGITLLVAQPDMGKSLFALWIARTITNDTPWPDGKPGPGKGYVLWCEAEDRQQINAQRAVTFGLDQEMLILPAYGGTEHQLESFRLDLPSHRKRLTALVVKYQPKLIIIDSLGAAHRGRENDSMMQGLLGDLRAAVRTPPTPILILHHLRKAGPDGRDIITADDVRGSTSIYAASVSCITMALYNPIDETTKRINHLKHNASLPEDALTFAWLEDSSELIFGKARQTEPIDVKATQRLEQAILAILDLGVEVYMDEVLNALVPPESKRLVYSASSRLVKMGFIEWHRKGRSDSALVKVE